MKAIRTALAVLACLTLLWSAAGGRLTPGARGDAAADHRAAAAPPMPAARSYWRYLPALR